MDKKVLTPKDEEFKRIFAAAVIEIGYCEMYPDAPSCQEDDLLEDEDYEFWEENEVLYDD